ncbi:AzlC family ABC transporter permease [Clostridiaceae bacterium NSJ-31]|uniref:AzlC family ABC transporter permease n=1 Tax=Ligaoa zhengdingensis TaxID=2763658 RepID=A0A926I0N3_9FIRM|nr:AzlC family ABC transporter permease [Ligaoa zhengdingensis]MBC8547187.1 AzlC family ABC transporter permease [Ligaoa zhengdingensis]
MDTKRRALRAAFPLTIPVMTGYLVLGTAYGILLADKGYGAVWALLTSLLIFAGSMQFVSIGLLTAGFHPLYACAMTLMVNARHLFYGIAMLGRYRGIKKVKPYLIFGLTDETFSIVCTTDPPEGVDRGWFYFFVTLLDQLYWVAGSVLGGLVGGLLPFDTTGMDFALTALFVVIFAGQWQERRNRLPALIGVGGSVLCRMLFGADSFVLPAMACILLLVTLLQKPLAREELP